METTPTQTIRRISFSIRGQTTKADIYFLNAISLKYFEKPYSIETRDEVHEIVRGLVADLKLPIHPQIIGQRILHDLVSKKMKTLLNDNPV